MRKWIRILLALVGAAMGAGIVAIVRMTGAMDSLTHVWVAAVFGLAGAAGFFLLYFISPMIIKNAGHSLEKASARLESVPLSDVAFGTGGLLIGLLIAMLVSSPIINLSIPYIGNILGVLLSVLIYIFLGLLFIRIALKNKEEIQASFQKLKESQTEKRQEKQEKKDRKAQEVVKLDKRYERIPKILDTSVIIDGRIFEVVETGFLEGPFIVSKYVLEELQHIADSSDSLRRERGRRGLDIVNKIRQGDAAELIIDEQDIDSVKEVDAKLLVLTKKLKGKIVTNDYNLNKVASVQSIPVLNVNDLANALKPVVIPGERMRIRVLKEGKEPNQGLAYLEDGTMIVVENGRDAIGKTVDTTVTSVLQTAAGKMIFVRI